MMNKILILLLLSGCTTSYKHLSDPRIENDGYDLICGGVEVGERFTAAVDICQNVASNGGEFMFVELQYNWSK